MKETSRAAARKRRMEKIQSSKGTIIASDQGGKASIGSQPLKKRGRKISEDQPFIGDNSDDGNLNDSLSSQEAAGAKKELLTKTGKLLNSYAPNLPKEQLDNMSKEQLAAWRKEARRVRNRESAAASRRKIKTRIDELQEEVAMWKAKYEEAKRKLNEKTGLRS